MVDERERLRKAMGEGASLPPEDPLRQELEAVISRTGQWAEKEWLEVLTQDEHVRIALRKVEVPGDLEQKLLAIPEQKISPRKQFRILSLKFIASAVAVILIVVIAVILFFPPKEQDFDQLAILAINDHINNRNLKVVTSDTAEFKNQLTGKVPFEVNLPEFSNMLKLSGGRPCKLGSHPIVYSLWSNSKGEFSLFQFRLVDFRFSQTAKPQIVKPLYHATKDDKSRCLIWSQDSSGFILVGEDESILKEISLRLK